MASNTRRFRGLPRFAQMPRFACLLVTAAAGCSGEATEPKVTIDSPLGVTFDQSQVDQGDTLTWVVTLPRPEAAVVGDELVLTFSGVAAGTDSVAIPSNIDGFSFGLVVPAGVPDGKLSLTVEIPAANQTAEASVKIKDTRPPLIDSAVVHDGLPAPLFNGLAGHGLLLFAAGLTDTLQVWASDNHDLAWIGWAIAAPMNVQDSIRVTGASAGAHFNLAIPDSLAGSGASVTLFASDADGNRLTYPIPVASITALNQHPVRSAALLDTIPDLAIDTNRGVVYLAQPDSARVAVLSLATMSYETPISFDGRPISVDLTPGGDSLFVVLDTATSLVVVQLAGSPQIVGAIPVHPNFYARGETIIHRVRVAADGHAVLTMVSSNTPPGSYIAERLDMTTDTTLLNPLTVEDPFPVAPPALARSGDGTIVYSPGDGGIWYNASTHVTEGGGGAWNPTEPFSVAVSNAASGVVMVGHWVFFNPGGGALGLDTLLGATIASNGTDAYAVASACTAGDVACADTASAMVLQYAMGPSYGAPDPFDPQAGRIVNVSSLPLGARSLVVSGDNKTLVAIGAHTVMAVDLTTSTPLSGSVVAGRRRVMIAGSTELAGPRRSPARHCNPGGSDTAWSLRSMLTMRVRRR